MRNRGIPRYLPREIARRRGASDILTHKVHDFPVRSRHMKARSRNACPSRIRNVRPQTMTWIVLPLLAAFPTPHCHAGSADTPPSPDNDRQAPRTGWREGSRRRQPARETAAPGPQSLSETCAQSLSTRSIPVTRIACARRSTATHHPKSLAKPPAAVLTSTNSSGNLIAAGYTVTRGSCNSNSPYTGRIDCGILHRLMHS